MRRLTIFSTTSILIGAVMLMAAAPFRVPAPPPAELSFNQFAKTYCVTAKTQEGKDTAWARTSIDMNLLKDTVLLEEVQAHELIHQAWYNKNITQCGHLTPKLALSLEVDAYCRTADIPVHYGGDSSLVYFRDATWLVSQFRESLPYHDVIAAWYIRCGDLLPKYTPPVQRSHPGHGE